MSTYHELEPLGVSLDGKPHGDLLDPKIAKYVNILRKHGVYTYESCQGGEGHSYPYPAIRFSGEDHEGFRELAIALCHNFPIDELCRVWDIINREPVGPKWEMRLIFPEDLEG